MPIFVTNPETKPKKSSGFFWQSPRHKGFTLVELLVVLAIGALLIGLVPMAFNKLQEGSQYRDTVRTIISELRQARQRAVAMGQVVVYQIDLNQRQYGLQGKPQRSMPKSLEIKTIVGQLAEFPANGVALIAFMPDGGSTGGTIEIARPSGGGVRIRVDWLLGQITQYPRQP